jgi:hypothetical protein
MLELLYLRPGTPTGSFGDPQNVKFTDAITDRSLSMVECNVSKLIVPLVSNANRIPNGTRKPAESLTGEMGTAREVHIEI